MDNYSTKKDTSVKLESDEELNELYSENNHIYFYTEINRKSSLKLQSCIRDAEKYCIVTALSLSIDKIPIYLHIYSNGGYVYSAFSIIDAIISCKVPIYSVIEGATSSAATLISIICKKRFIRPNAYMRIHQIRSNIWGTMLEITDEFQNIVELTNKVIKIYTENSKLSLKQVTKLLKHEILLNSDECMKNGFVDELL
jgi:ATP-dependent protease ClpP protease subunit